MHLHLYIIGLSTLVLLSVEIILLCSYTVLRNVRYSGKPTYPLIYTVKIKIQNLIQGPHLECWDGIWVMVWNLGHVHSTRQEMDLSHLVRESSRVEPSVIGHGAAPMILSRMVLNRDPCRGFVMISAIILSVGQYTSLIMFLVRRSCIQKNPMRMWRESSDVGLPFSTSLIVD